MVDATALAPARPCALCMDRPALGARLRRWTSELLPSEFRRFPVIVSELNCEDTGCDCRGSIDRTATEIAVLLPSSHRLHSIKATWDARVHKELVDVTFEDLRVAMEQQLGLGVGLGCDAAAADGEAKSEAKVEGKSAGGRLIAGTEGNAAAAITLEAAAADGTVAAAAAAAKTTASSSSTIASQTQAKTAGKTKPVAQPNTSRRRGTSRAGAKRSISVLGAGAAGVDSRDAARGIDGAGSASISAIPAGPGTAATTSTPSALSMHTDVQVQGQAQAGQGQGREKKQKAET